MSEVIGNAKVDNAATDAYAERVRADARCTVERSAEVLSGKWTTLILRDLLGGPKRFGELRRSLVGVSPKTLTDRLKSLEAEGILTRTLYPEMPPRTEYRLTDKGAALRSVIEAMAAWGKVWT